MLWEIPHDGWRWLLGAYVGHKWYVIRNVNPLNSKSWWVQLLPTRDACTEHCNSNEECQMITYEYSSTTCCHIAANYNLWNDQTGWSACFLLGCGRKKYLQIFFLHLFFGRILASCFPVTQERYNLLISEGSSEEYTCTNRKRANSSPDKTVSWKCPN